MKWSRDAREGGDDVQSRQRERPRPRLNWEHRLAICPKRDMQMAVRPEVVGNRSGHKRRGQPGLAREFFDASLVDEMVVGRLQRSGVFEVHLPLPAPGFSLRGADEDSGRLRRLGDGPQEWLLRDSGDRSVGRTRRSRRFQTLKTEPARISRVVLEEIELQLGGKADP